MPKEVLIGIDVGTSNIKLVAITFDGYILSVLSKKMWVHRPSPGWAEFDLKALEECIYKGLREIVLALPSSMQVAAIAIASIGESVVGIDSDGRVATCCPTWFDRRTFNYRIPFGLSSNDWYNLTGMTDDDIYSLYRIRWMVEHGEVNLSQIDRWMCVADFCVYRLTKEVSTVPSLAARTGAYDRNAEAWSRDLLDLVGLAPEKLPLIRPAASIAGRLSKESAMITGLRFGIPVINAGHDHPCAGVGCGLLSPGPLMDSTGTAEAVKTVVDKPLTYRETLEGRYDCYPHAVPSRFVLSGHLPAAGGLISWLASIFQGGAPNQKSADSDEPALLEHADISPPGANGVRVLPFLEGSGSPFNQRGQAAEILGLRGYHTRADLLRAVLEGCAYWLRVNVETLGRIVKTDIDQIIAVGGGARSDLWTVIKSAVLGRAITVPILDEAGAYGAALIAGLGIGVPGITIDTIPMAPTKTVEAPVSDQIAYKEIVRLYNDLYRERFGVI